MPPRFDPLAHVVTALPYYPAPMINDSRQYTENRYLVYWPGVKAYPLPFGAAIMRPTPG